MTCNVGLKDHAGRTVVGIVLLGGALVPSIGLDWRIALLVVASVALVTAVICY